MDIVQEDLDRGARYRFDWKTANVKGLSEPRLPSRGAFRCEYDENVIVVIDFAPGKGCY